MNLQPLLFPNTEICARNAMYFKVTGPVNLLIDECRCDFEKNGELRSSTYFNCFSIGKWKKYTKIDNLSLNLKLQGFFLVEIIHLEKINGIIIEKVITTKNVHSASVTDVNIKVPFTENCGLYYFHLIALSDDSHFYGGFYATEISEDCLPEINIAIGICTFRREKFVIHNIECFRKYLIENEKSPLYNHLEIMISDNGKTLPETLNSEHVHIYPNKNLGGAGGFTRAMIEIFQQKEKLKTTHILLMDDDVKIDPNAIVRTYRILQFLKEEYSDAFIGGGMLRLDTQHIQSELADHWDMTWQHPVKYMYNLEQINMLLKNEIEDSINHFGWWYCCMPIQVVNKNNLPLPLFIKRDDIEYGLRNGRTFITMNGICVWHEPFEFKSASYLEYYYFRNMCIINSRHRLSFSSKRLIKDLRKRIINAVMRYRFKEAELSLIGVQDYLKGIDWFKAQDGEKLNQAIMSMAYPKQPVQDIDFVFTHGNFEKNLQYEENRKTRFLRLLSLNGWLLPANRSVVVPAHNPVKAHFYRARRVLNYEDAYSTGFITKKSYRDLFHIWRLYRKTVRLIKKKFVKVTLEYRNRYNELTSLEYWNDYLYRDGEKPDIHSVLEDASNKKIKNTKFQKREYFKSIIVRLIQCFLFWLPVKKNRVMVYVHDRRGFTCNPKYIVQHLKEEFGDRLEILWVSSYPDSCQEIKDLGIPVLAANSKFQIIKYLRTRMYITNDAFPSWAIHRWNQKWLNTWHAGMNYKHIGFDYLAPMSSLGKKLFKIKNRQPDFYLSGSEFFTNDTSKSFHFKKSCFIPTGLPRNDLFFQERPDIKTKIRSMYGIDANKKIVLFAPTFRRGMKSNTYGLDFDKVLTSLSERFGGEWVILFRNHYFVKSKQSYFQKCIDVSAYDDMQELLFVADVLITDYSSCMWDFSLTTRPCFVYANDLQQYIHSDRSLACPVGEWPFPVAETNVQLVENILCFNQEKYQEVLKQHLKEKGSFDRGTASAQVSGIVKKYCLK